ncbi:hypothetical protein QYF36_003746 [Acer negundo]|nr:hypothetical protein QYF36_003746 [Acer negundo]
MVNKTKWDPIESLELNHPTLVLLEKCSSRDHFRQILGQMMRIGLIDKTFPMSRLILYSAISHPENLDMSILLFTYFTHPNLFIYKTMISALSFSFKQAYVVYKSMLRSSIWPEKQTLLYLLKAAKHVSEAKQVHCHAIVMGLVSYDYFLNSLLKMFMNNGKMDLARKVFSCRSSSDVASFNIMIVGHAKKGNSLEAIKMFREMVDSGLEPDEFTISGLLVCCGQLADVQLGKSVHAWMERRKHISSSNLVLGNALLHMYVKCKEIELGQRTFDALRVKDIVSWNTMFEGFVKVGELESARSLFNHMPCRDLVSWNSLICSYAQNDDLLMMTKVFKDMVAENVMPDNVTMTILVAVAAEVAELNQGRWIHGMVVRTGMKINAFLGSALINLYWKCGSIEKAFVIFRDIAEKDVTVWTTMITGFAFHGYGRKALELFSEMQEEEMPNKVTIVAVLTACVHCGLVDEGLELFSSMKENYGIEPGIEHYGYKRHPGWLNMQSIIYFLNSEMRLHTDFPDDFWVPFMETC